MEGEGGVARLKSSRRKSLRNLIEPQPVRCLVNRCRQTSQAVKPRHHRAHLCLCGIGPGGRGGMLQGWAGLRFSFSPSDFVFFLTLSSDLQVFLFFDFSLFVLRHQAIRGLICRLRCYSFISSEDQFFSPGWLWPDCQLCQKATVQMLTWITTTKYKGKSAWCVYMNYKCESAWCVYMNYKCKSAWCVYMNYEATF